MEKTNIGFKAGIILEKLGETGLITIAELARRLNFAADETALAAGWLARICLKNQKSIFQIVQNDIATVEHKDRSSYKME